MKSDPNKFEENVLEQVSDLVDKNDIVRAICDDCHAFLNKNEVEYMDTSKWGYERPFCSNCIYHCKSCDEEYVSDTSYRHDDCDGSDSESDTKDETKQEEAAEQESDKESDKEKDE